MHDRLTSWCLIFKTRILTPKNVIYIVAWISFLFSLPFSCRSHNLDLIHACMSYAAVSFSTAWFPYVRKNRVTIFLNGQFIIVYTCKPHINHKYSLVIITPRIFCSKMLYFGWWERSWLNLYDRYELMGLITILHSTIMHAENVTPSLILNSPTLTFWEGGGGGGGI
jgi:hypothetical protein